MGFKFDGNDEEFELVDGSDSAKPKQPEFPTSPSVPTKPKLPPKPAVNKMETSAPSQPEPAAPAPASQKLPVEPAQTQPKAKLPIPEEVVSTPAVESPSLDYENAYIPEVIQPVKSGIESFEEVASFTEKEVKRLDADDPVYVNDVKPEEVAVKKSKKAKNTRASRKRVNPNIGWLIGVRISVVFALIGMFALSVWGIVRPGFTLDETNGQRITAIVKNNLGITDFPAEVANSFVLSFAKTYLNVDASKTGIRKDELAAYVPTDLLMQMNLIRVDGEAGGQRVTFGPIVTGITEIDANNAVFTIYAEVTPLADKKTIAPGVFETSSQVTMRVPVYYTTTNSRGELIYQMAISGMPSFIPTLTLAQLPSNVNPSINAWINDSAIANSDFKVNLAKYLQAWAASDGITIETYTTPDATLTAKLGLMGEYQYQSGQAIKLSVQGLDPARPLRDPNMREAVVTVLWTDKKNPLITYEHMYRLIIKMNADGRWLVHDIGNMYEQRIGRAIQANYLPVED